MQRPFRGEYTVCALEVPLKMRSSSKLKISHIMGDLLILGLSHKQGNKRRACQSATSLAKLTKILHGQRGLPRPVLKRGQSLRLDVDSERRPPCMEAVNALAMDQSFHTNRFRLTQKRPASHFPSGSRPRTSHRVPCLCKGYRLLISQMGNAD